MKNLLLTMTLVFSVGAAAQAAGPNPNGSLKGDYVEARTASVFAGPCHYNGELTTTGRDAVMAWSIQEGTWKGTSLSGLTVVATVSSDANLKEDVARHSVLYVDSKATVAQSEALTEAFKANYGKSLGDVVTVKRIPITFTHKGEAFRVQAKGAIQLTVEAMPHHECCKMPSLVCYNPLIELTDRKVGYTRSSSVKENALGATWTKNGQNTAFYGTFSF